MFFAAVSCCTQQNTENVLPALMWNAGETVRPVERTKNLRDFHGAAVPTGYDPEGWKAFKQALRYCD